MKGWMDGWKFEAFVNFFHSSDTESKDIFEIHQKILEDILTDASHQNMLNL